MSNSDGLFRYGVDYASTPQEPLFISDTTGDSLLNDIPLGVVPIDLKLSVSSSQFNKLLSAALNGAYRFYPSEVNDVVYPLIKAAKEYCEAMSCQDVADCIDNSEPVQTSITNQIVNNSDNRIAIARQFASQNDNVLGFDPLTTTIPTSVKDDNEPISRLEDCDLDRLWGGIREGIVARLDENVRNFLEELVSINDLAERLEGVLKAIPLLGSSAEALSEQITQVLPDMLNLFNAYSSSANLDDAACDIFGLVCSECRYPTYRELFDYFGNQGITGISDIDNIVFATASDLFFDSSQLSSLIFWHTSIAFSLIVLYLNSRFNNALGVGTIELYAALGEDFASNNWSDLCNTCGEQYVYEDWDFVTQGKGDWTIDAVNQKGEFIAGEGWKGSVDGASKHARIQRNIDPTWIIVGVGFLTEYTGSPTTTNSGWTFRLTRNSNTGAANQSLGSCTGTDYNRANDGITQTGWSQVLISTLCSPQATTECYIRKVRIVYQRGASPDGVLQASRDFCP